MSYRLIDANDLNGKISDEDYEVVLKEPCIYADLPNGMDGKGYDMIPWDKIPKNATNGDIIKLLFPNKYGEQCGRTKAYYNIDAHNRMEFQIDWWNAPYKESEE